MALDRALRAFGGAPTYALTDTSARCRSITFAVAVRNPTIVSVGRHYGLTIATCVPADPLVARRTGASYRRKNPPRMESRLSVPRV
jgi:hypothetical protein